MSKIKVRRLTKICDFSDEYGNCEKVAIYGVTHENKEYNFCENCYQKFFKSIKEHKDEGAFGIKSVPIATPQLGGVKSFAQFGSELPKNKTKNLNEISFAMETYRIWLELASLEDIGILSIGKETYKTLVHNDNNVIYYYDKNNKPAFICDVHGRNKRYIRGIEIDIK